MNNLFFQLIVSSVFLIAIEAGLIQLLPLRRGSERVVGGYEVRPKFKYSFMVSIQYMGKQSCGGTFLSGDKIITAAHCVFDEIGKFTVHAHRHDLRLNDQSENGSVYTVLKRIVHPNFKSAATGYDVSIWTLIQNNVTLSTQRTIVKLDPGELGTKIDLPLHAIGWGRTSDGGLASPTLLEVILPVVDPIICANNYRPQGLVLDSSTQICAGYVEDVGQDTCQGDSGGPLFIYVQGIPYLVGLVSYGIGCANPTLPGLYARISNLSGFIQSNL